MFQDYQLMVFLADISLLQAIQQAQKDNSNEIGFIKAPQTDLFEAEINWWDISGVNIDTEKELNTYKRMLLTVETPLSNTRMEPPTDDNLPAYGDRPRVWDWNHAWVAFHADPSLAGLYAEFLPNAIADYNQRMSRNQSLHTEIELRVPPNSNNQLSVA